MTTAASLPTTRPTSDTYGPDLTNDDPVADREHELDADNWNKIKADVAAACEVAPLAILRVTNDGVTPAVARQRPTALGTVTVSRLSAGHVQVTLPGDVAPIDAVATPVGNGALAASTTNTYSTAVYISGSTVDVYTANSGGAADVDFMLVIY